MIRMATDATLISTADTNHAARSHDNERRCLDAVRDDLCFDDGLGTNHPPMKPPFPPELRARGRSEGAGIPPYRAAARPVV